MMKEKLLVSENELNRQTQIAARIEAENAGLDKLCFVETYGCQMNVRDSETIYGQLLRMGYRATADRDKADVLIFNTCCVRDHAEKRVYGNIGALRERKQEKPELIIGVSGCMMQQNDVAKRLMRRFPYVNLVFGTNVLHRLPEMFEMVLQGERVCVTDSDDAIAEGLPALRDSSVSAFVNIMYGCNNFCSYCIVPYVRGRERSRSVEDIVGEIEALAKTGIKEITLLGQNVNSYSSEGADFAELLQRVNRIQSISRIRFMSSHPKDLSDRVIDAIAGCDKVCHHVHLPVQSGSDRILALMNRKYTRERYLEIMSLLRQRIDDIEFTTDIIVGFPTEMEEDFEQTLSLVSKAQYASAFTFKYSPRAGTAAAKMDGQVEEAVKKDRLLRLNELQAVYTRLDNEKYLGYVGEVLIEGFDERDETLLYGKYSNFKMVYFKGDPSRVGQFATVKAERCMRNSLIGSEVK